MDGTEVRVLEKSHDVGLSRLLESQQSGRLEAELSLEVLGDLSAEALERQLADEELGGLLVLADLSESDSARAVSI